VLVPPLPVELLDRPAGILGDRPRPQVRAEPGVVVDRVVGEVGRDLLDVAGVERRVVAADVIEGRDRRILPRPVDFGAGRSSLG
jgi:hypothetical protein